MIELDDVQPAKWGIMGTGNIARKALVPALKESESSKLDAIASRNLDRAKEFAEEFEIPKAFGSYRDLLKDTEVEFVYLPLPNHLHHKWVIESAKKGKNILCEKPIALSVKEVEDMIEVSEENEVTLMEGFMYRFHPQTLRVKELVDQGEIGKPNFFRGSFSFPLILQDRGDDIRWKEEMGGGSLMDLGTYSVNTVRYLFDDEPTEVFATQSYHPDYSAEAATQAILKFRDGRMGIIDSSFVLSFKASYEVVSDIGKIHADNTYNPGVSNEATVRVTTDGVTELESFGGINEYREEVDHLVSCAHQGNHPKIFLMDSLHNTEVLVAIRESARKNKWVSLEG